LSDVVRATWDEAWTSLGIAPPDAHDDLRARYAEPQRAYHTGQHLEECCEWLFALRESATRLAEVQLALLFHDAVYDPQAHDNEARSADLAATTFRAAGVGDETIDRVGALILATAHRVVPDAIDPAAADTRLLVEIDLAILGAPADRFDEYERQVREEYSWVPADRYRAGRSAILQGFLSRPAIFQVEPLRARLEPGARANLARSIARLALRG
jgi:predicted metal-dependent HD superfamily phosphohydrolase